MKLLDWFRLQWTLLVLGVGAMLAIQTATQKNALADAYKVTATHGALYNIVPGTTGPTTGQELSGGSPAYARIVLAWGASSNGVTSSGPHTFNVASGSTVAGGGVHNSATISGSPDTTYRDGASLTSQAFASQGTYALTLTYTQT